MVTLMTTDSLVALLRVYVMQNVPLEIELPWGEVSTFVVSPSLTLGEVLAYVCAKSGLNPSKHAFDLPIANLDTLRLQQLRLSQIKMLRKGYIVEKEEKSMNVGSREGSNLQLAVLCRCRG